MRGYMIMEVELPGNCAAVLEGSMIKYWIGEGLPVFIGTLDEFSEFYPEEFQKLVNIKAIKASKGGDYV